MALQIGVKFSLGRNGFDFTIQLLGWGLSGGAKDRMMWAIETGYYFFIFHVSLSLDTMIPY